MNKTSFCIVRNPVDRALSEFKMRYLGSNHHLSNMSVEAIVPLADQFLRRLMADKNVFGYDCHYVAQYEYVWDAQFKRTCEHVLPFEGGGLYGRVNQLLSSYPRTRLRFKSNFTEDLGSSHHVNVSLSMNDLPSSVVTMVRNHYWKDMCLFGYDLRATNPSPRPSYSNPDNDCVGGDNDHPVSTSLSTPPSLHDPLQCADLRKLYQVPEDLLYSIGNHGGVFPNSSSMLEFIKIPHSAVGTIDADSTYLKSRVGDYLTHGDCKSQSFNSHCSVNMACKCK